MEQKTIQSTTVYYRNIKTSLSTMMQYVGQTPNEMYAALAQQNLIPQGPQIWIYRGADGYPDTVFDLQIAIPVSSDVQINQHGFRELPEFKCFCMMHLGPWENLKDSYMKIIEYISQSGLQMSDECREIYHTCDFENQHNNVTEIQIGLL